METTAQQLTVTRTIRASRQRVFRAWTEPELMMRWFVEADWRDEPLRDRPARGRPLPVRGRDRRQEMGRSGAPTSRCGPPRGSSTRGSGSTTTARRSEGDTQVTVEFRERGAETELVLTHERFASARAREEHAEGWRTCLDRIERLLSE